MNKLTDQHFSFKCPMNFNAMQPSANGVFCNKCSKEVFDLTDCTIDEVIALQRKHGRICGSIRVMPLVAVAASLSAAACCPSSPQGNPQGNHRDSKDVHCYDHMSSGGEVCPPYELIKSK